MHYHLRNSRLRVIFEIEVEQGAKPLIVQKGDEMQTQASLGAADVEPTCPKSGERVHVLPGDSPGRCKFVAGYGFAGQHEVRVPDGTKVWIEGVPPLELSYTYDLGNFRSYTFDGEFLVHTSLGGPSERVPEIPVKELVDQSLYLTIK